MINKNYESRFPQEVYITSGNFKPNFPREIQTSTRIENYSPKSSLKFQTSSRNYEANFPREIKVNSKHSESNFKPNIQISGRDYGANLPREIQVTSRNSKPNFKPNVQTTGRDYEASFPREIQVNSRNSEHNFKPNLQTTSRNYEAGFPREIQVNNRNYEPNFQPNIHTTGRNYEVNFPREIQVNNRNYEISYPREIQISNRNLQPGTRIQPYIKNYIYEISSSESASIVASKKRKRESPQELFYKASNPKTTTISFVWGKPDVTSTTTSRPFLVNSTHTSKKEPFQNIQNTRWSQGDRSSSSMGYRPTQDDSRGFNSGRRREDKEEFWRSNYSYESENKRISGQDNFQGGDQHPHNPHYTSRDSKFTSYSRNEAWSKGRSVPFSNPTNDRHSSQRGLSLLDSRHYSIQNDPTTLDNVRNYNIEEGRAASGSSGFWSSNSRNIFPDKSTHGPISYTSEKNYPRPIISRDRQSIASGEKWGGQFVPSLPPWRNPPTPSASIREITYDTSPSPSTSKYQINESESTKNKRKPVIQGKSYFCFD